MKSSYLSLIEAENLFKILIKKYGTKWNVLIPPEAHAQMAQCNKMLSQPDRERLMEEVAVERDKL